MTTVDTYTATIYCGLREWYEVEIHHPAEAREICQDFVDEVGLCVTVTETTFIYTKGSEPGLIIGLINYPRYPSTPAQTQDKAILLARKLMEAFNQQRMSIVMPDKTIMLEKEEK